MRLDYILDDIYLVHTTHTQRGREGGRERAVERDAQTSKGRLRDARGSILAVARLALSLAVQSLIPLGQSF